jgi:hypothetical protein
MCCFLSRAAILYQICLIKELFVPKKKDAKFRKMAWKKVISIRAIRNSCVIEKYQTDHQ